MNTASPAARRGYPLVALAVLITAWAAARVVIPLAPPSGLPRQIVASPASAQRGDGPGEAPRPVVRAEPARPAVARRALPRGFAMHPATAAHDRSRSAALPVGPASAAIAHREDAGVLASRSPAAATLDDGPGGRPGDREAPPPSLTTIARRDAPAPGYVAVLPRRSAKRWSADGWLLMREAGRGRAAGAGVPSYGASQAGAVIRYALAPRSRRHPRAFLRLSAAIDGPEEVETAAGLAVRPVPAWPVDLLIEGRAGRFAGDSRLRPAALLVAAPAARRLPFELRAESYVQAGYVGGEGSTGFVDGQLRVDRPLPSSTPGTGALELRIGGGVWGGAQENAARLDAGPGVVAVLPLGNGVFARASLDYRRRIAGDAEPGSGPVFTLSAGF